MNRILENAKYIVLIAVAAFLIAAIATYLLGAFKVIDLFVMLVADPQNSAALILSLLEMIDIFLIGTVLFIFAIGFHDLFIGKVNTPEWLVIDDLGKLKTKLADVIVLFMAIKFLDKLLQSKDALDTLLYAAAIAIVSAVLIALNRTRGGAKE